jgi:hypothetical protein
VRAALSAAQANLREAIDRQRIWIRVLRERLDRPARDAGDRPAPETPVTAVGDPEQAEELVAHR